MFSCRYLELFQCNNVVGYWAYIRGGGLYWGGPIFGGGGYIWNEVSVST